MAFQQILIAVFSISAVLFLRTGEAVSVQHHGGIVNRFKRYGCLDSPIPYDVECHNSCPPGRSDWEWNSNYWKCNDSLVYHCRPDQNHDKIDGCARRIGCFNGTEAIMYKDLGVYKLRCDPCKDGYFNDKDHYSTSEVTCKQHDFCVDEYILCEHGTRSTNNKCACNYQYNMKAEKRTKESCQFKDELHCVRAACPAGSILDGPPDYKCIGAAVTPESTQPSSSVISPVVTVDSVTVAGKALSETCRNVTECSTEHAVCDNSVCTCPNTTYRSDQNCLEYVPFNGLCKETKQCSITDGGICIEKRCVCQNAYRHDELKKKCIKKVHYVSYNGLCDDSTQCSTIGSKCLQMRCVCEATHGHKILTDECIRIDGPERLPDWGIILITFIVLGFLACVIILLCWIFRKKIKELRRSKFPSCCKEENELDTGSPEERLEMIQRNSVVEEDTGSPEERLEMIQRNSVVEEEPTETTLALHPERNRTFLEGNPNVCKDILSIREDDIVNDLPSVTYIEMYRGKYAGDMTKTEQNEMRDLKDMHRNRYISSEINRRILDLAERTGVNGYYRFKGCLEGHLLELLETEEDESVNGLNSGKNQEDPKETDTLMNGLNSGENQEDPKETDTLMNGLNSGENQENPKETDTLMNGLTSGENQENPKETDTLMNDLNSGEI